jgi:hypothetical protein
MKVVGCMFNYRCSGPACGQYYIDNCSSTIKVRSGPFDSPYDQYRVRALLFWGLPGAPGVGGAVWAHPVTLGVYRLLPAYVELRSCTTPASLSSRGHLKLRV